MAHIQVDKNIVPIASEFILTVNSPLYSNEQPFSYSFEVDETPETNEALGYVIYPEAKGLVTIPGCRFVCTQFTLPGTLYIVKTDKAYSGNFVANSAIEVLKNIQLNKLTDKYYRIPANNIAGYDTNYTDQKCADVMVETLKGQMDYVFAPILNYKMHDDNEVFPTYLPENKSHVFYNNFDLTLANNFEGSARWLGFISWAVPFFFTRVIINKLLQKCNVKVTENVFDFDTDLAQLVIFNYMAINKFELRRNDSVYKTASNISKEEKAVVTIGAAHNFVEGDYVTFVCSEGAGMQEINHLYSKISNVETNSFTVDIDTRNFSDFAQYVNVFLCRVCSDYSDITLGKHLPAMSGLEFIHEIEKFLGIVFDFSMLNSRCRILSVNDIITSPNITDVSEFCTSNIKIEHTPIDGFKLGYTPDGDDRYFTENVVEIKDGLNLLPSVDSLPTEATHNDLRRVNAADYWGVYWLYQKSLMKFNQWYLQANKYVHNGGIDGEWQKYSLDLYGKKEGKEELDLTSNVGLMIWNGLATGGDGIPSTPMVGNTQKFYSFPVDADTKSLRFFFYRGLHLNKPNGELKPLATCGVRDHQGNKIDYAALELRYAGPFGLYEKRHRQWIEFKKNSKNATAQINWPSIAEFDFLQKYAVNGVWFMVKSFKLKVNPVTDEITFLESEIDLKA